MKCGPKYDSLSAYRFLVVEDTGYAVAEIQQALEFSQRIPSVFENLVSQFLSNYPIFGVKSANFAS